MLFRPPGRNIRGVPTLRMASRSLFKQISRVCPLLALRSYACPLKRPAAICGGILEILSLHFLLFDSLRRCHGALNGWHFLFPSFLFLFFFSVYTSVLLGSLCQLWKMEIISKNYEEGVVHTSTYSQNAGINCASDLRHGSKYMPGQPACRTTVHFFFFLLGLSYF